MDGSQAAPPGPARPPLPVTRAVHGGTTRRPWAFPVAAPFHRNRQGISTMISSETQRSVPGTPATALPAQATTAHACTRCTCSAAVIANTCKPPQAAPGSGPALAIATQPKSPDRRNSLRLRSPSNQILHSLRRRSPLGQLSDDATAGPRKSALRWHVFERGKSRRPPQAAGRNTNVDNHATSRRRSLFLSETVISYCDLVKLN